MCVQEKGVWSTIGLDFISLSALFLRNPSILAVCFSFKKPEDLTPEDTVPENRDNLSNPVEMLAHW